jgi:hypothetical protein
MIPDISNSDSCLLPNFPANGLFYRFTLINKSSERREGIGLAQPSMRLTEQTAITLNNHHNYHGIGAGKILVAAFCTGSRMTSSL